MLGSKAIIDRDDDTMRRIGEMTAEAVMGVEIADDPAAAMEIDEGGKDFPASRRRAAIEPQRDDRTGCSWRREFANFGHRRRIGRQYLARREKQFARLGRAQRLVGRPPGQPHHFENALGIAIERHQGAPLTKGSTFSF